MKSGSTRDIKDQKIDLTSLVYNPQVLPKHFEVVIEGEQQVLGELLMIHNAYYEVDDVMKSHFFYQKRHQILFEAIEAMHGKAIEVDLKSAVHYLRSIDKLDDAGGAAYLADLVAKATGNINRYVHGIIREEYLRRKVIEICARAVNTSKDPANEIFDVLDRIEDETNKLHHELQPGTVKDLKQEVISLIDNLGKNLAKNNEFTGIPSGFIRLDRLTQGWQKSDLIIIAARPGMGKTSLVVTMMLNSAIHFKKPAVLFSLEMSTRQILQRMISNLGQVDMDNWKKRGVDFHSQAEKEHFQEEVAKWGSVITESESLHIDDTPSIALNELRNRAKRLVREKGVELIVVDYLQLMKDSGETNRTDNREQVISAISRGLKALAKELDVPVIALSQLSRAVETRGGDKRPILSDLRESGSIEQDADVVMFIYRPEYYGITMDEMGNSTLGQAEFIVAKHRNGSLDNIKSRYIGEYVKFQDP
uniref:Replicative DNA helicase n=1 Tax=Microscilla sp. PRE1 TaxID=155537 RepID=Q93PC7_9BACT|nr:replicative DNA helicase [Microscilla sp. PRE1]AAK62824.1 MS102, putative replicative DNA helicase [Microscilla sp. PRE1]